MQFRLPHPWDPEYALPDEVMAEPPRFGTLTTAYRPRRSIDAPAIAAPWKTGYAYPDYISEEPIGAGVFRTKYTPRKTVDTLVPEYLSGLGADIVHELETTPDINIRGGSAWLQAAQARYGDPLGGVGYTTPINADAGAAWIEAADQRYGFSLGDDAHAQDAIGQFGQEVAAYVLATANSLPQSERKAYLRQLFDTLEPGLWSRVARKGNEFRAQGLSDRDALQAAIASQVSYGLLQQIIRTGKHGAPAPKSMLGCLCGLGSTEVVVSRRGGTDAGDSAGRVQVGPFVFREPVDIGSKIRIHDAKLEMAAKDRFKPGGRVVGTRLPRQLVEQVQKILPVVLPSAGTDNKKKLDYLQTGNIAVAKVKLPNGRSAVIKLYKSATGITVKIEKPARSLAGIVSWPVIKLAGAGVKAVQKGYDAAKDAADWIGDKACDLLNSDAGRFAAQAGAIAAGEPPQIGEVGAQIAGGMCANGGGGPLPPPPEESRFPTTLVLLGGAAVAAYLLLKKKGK